MDNKAMHNLTYGLFVLTTSLEGEDNGCIINTAGQVTTEPNRISITVNNTNHTTELIKKSGKFNISTLSEDANFEVFKHFGFKSGREVNKFDGYSACKRSANGIYYTTEGVNSYISATVEQTIDLGTHTMFIAKVDAMEVLTKTPSATYAYYHANIKPKAEPKTEQSANKGKVAWRCKVCGYVYVGEELPADFTCPLCKHPASDFEKIIL